MMLVASCFSHPPASRVSPKHACCRFESPIVLLDAWSRLPDGRFTGTLGDDRTVWLTVAARSRCLDAEQPGPKYVETIAGAVYELGEPSNPKFREPALSPRSWAAVGSWGGDEDLPFKIISLAGASVVVLCAALAVDSREASDLMSMAAISQPLLASTAFAPAVTPAVAPSVTAAALEHAATTSAATAAVAGYTLAAEPAEGVLAVERLVAAAASEYSATITAAAAAVVAQFS